MQIPIDLSMLPNKEVVLDEIESMKRKDLLKHL